MRKGALSIPIIALSHGYEALVLGRVLQGISAGLIGVVVPLYLAECLAARLGYRCVGREAIVERAAASGVSHQDLLDALLKAPGFLDRFKHTRYQYLALFQAALAEEVKSGNVVYHGNAGHLMLKGARAVLRVRVVAPFEKRLAMLEERLNLRGNEALDAALGDPRRQTDRGDVLLDETGEFVRVRCNRSSVWSRNGGREKSANSSRRYFF
jgi:hypothetical protein